MSTGGFKMRKRRILGVHKSNLKNKMAQNVQATHSNQNNKVIHLPFFSSSFYDLDFHHNKNIAMILIPIPNPSKAPMDRFNP